LDLTKGKYQYSIGSKAGLNTYLNSKVLLVHTAKNTPTGNHKGISNAMKSIRKVGSCARIKNGKEM